MKREIGLIFFLFFLLFVCPPGISKDRKQELFFGDLAREIDSIAFTQGTKAKALLTDELYPLAVQSPDSASFLIKCLYIEASLNYAQGINSPDLIHRIEEQLDSIRQQRNETEEEALLSYALALSHSTNGDFGNAFSPALQAFEIYKTLDNTRFVAKSLMALGNICVSIKNYNMGEDYFREAIALLNSSTRDYYQAHLNLYRLFFYSDRSAKAIELILTLVPELKKFGDIGLIVNAYTNLGACYSANEMYEMAYPYYDTVYNLIDRVDNKKFIATIYQNLGVYYYQKEDIEKAHLFFETGKKIAEESRNPEMIADALYNLSYSYSQLNLPDSAYQCILAYTDMSQRLVNNSKTIEAYQTYISVLLESSENKLIIAEQKIELRNRWLLFTATSFIAIVTVITLLLLLLRQQKRIKEAENRDLEERLEHEQKILQLQKNMLKAQEREITSSSLLISSKNSILQQISELTDDLPTDQKAQAKIKKIVKNNLSSDSDWKTFLLHFEKVHPGFFTKLKAHGKNLTKTNLKLCAYMRIGMDSKQIAQILNVSDTSVRMHRYRIKQKLGLGEEENLDDFLRNV